MITFEKNMNLDRVISESISVFCFFVLLTACNESYVTLADSEVRGGVNGSCGVTRSDINEYGVSLKDAISFVDAHHFGEIIEVKPYCEENDTLLYIFNFSKGWLLLSADKRVSPVLSSSYDGVFDLEEIPFGVSIWMKTEADNIRYMRYHSPENDNEYTDLWARLLQSRYKPSFRKSSGEGRNIEKWYAVDLGYEEIGRSELDYVPHLITTKWGQGYPWNFKCPVDTSLSPNVRCYLGCTATACGQLLYYMHYYNDKPNDLYHSISCSKDYVNGSTYNIGFSRSNLVQNSSRWNSMAVNSSGSSVGIEYAGDLMLDVGNRFNMHYSGSGSGAWPNLSALYNYYNIAGISGNYNYFDVTSDLISDRPVVIVAFSSTNPSSGHTWLIDGIHKTTVYYNHYKQFCYGEDWYLYSEYYDTWEEVRDQYNHLIQDPSETLILPWEYTYSFFLMNWGYDGLYDNGYYGLTSSWNVNGSDHAYNRIIYYDFQ